MTLIIAIGGLFLVLYFLGIVPYVVLSGSMEPTIKTGSLCFVNKNISIDKIKEKDIIVYDVPCLDIELCIFCGQAFRWKKNEDGSFHGIVEGKVTDIIQAEDKIIFRNTSENDFKNLWKDYFENNYPILTSMYESSDIYERYWVNECVNKLNEIIEENDINKYISRTELTTDGETTIKDYDNASKVTLSLKNPSDSHVKVKYNFVVDDEFPKVDKVGLNHRIFDVKYTVNLDGIPSVKEEYTNE